MEIRRAAFLVVLLLVLPSIAHADRHRPDAAFSVSALGGSALYGGHGTFSWPFARYEHHRVEVSAVASIAGYRGTEDGRKPTLIPLLFGLRGTFPGGMWLGKTKFALFSQLLGGGLRRTEDGNPGKQYPFAAAFNAGTEWPACRPTRMRFQVELLTHNSHGTRRWGRGASLGVSWGGKYDAVYLTNCTSRHSHPPSP